MSASDSPAPVPTSRLAWPARLRPFRAVARQGTGPRLDLDRDWPELAFIALAVLLFWRGAPVAEVPNAVEVAGRAILHPVFGLPAALLGVTDWRPVCAPRRPSDRSGRHVVAGRRSGVGAARTPVGQPGLRLRRWGRGRVAGRSLWPGSGVPWMPWALACALLAVRLRRRLYAAGAAAALALILLGGDFGLTCATVAVLALFLLVAAQACAASGPTSSCAGTRRSSPS